MGIEKADSKLRIVYGKKRQMWQVKSILNTLRILNVILLLHEHVQFYFIVSIFYDRT